MSHLKLVLSRVLCTRRAFPFFSFFFSVPKLGCEAVIFSEEVVCLYKCATGWHEPFSCQISSAYRRGWNLERQAGRNEWFKAWGYHNSSETDWKNETGVPPTEKISCLVLSIIIFGWGKCIFSSVSCCIHWIFYYYYFFFPIIFSIIFIRARSHPPDSSPQWHDQPGRVKATRCFLRATWPPSDHIDSNCCSCTIKDGITYSEESAIRPPPRTWAQTPLIG